MKLNKSGFTFVELIGALFICSLLFVFLVPNMVRQYANLSKIEKELEKREVWVKEQILIEEVRTFFDTLYIKYLELNKDSETLELVIGNGIVKIKNKNVYYPILLKKVRLDFDAKNNILKEIR